MGKAFEKHLKTIEDQGLKQVGTLKNFKPKEQTKSIERKSNNQSRATIIFNNLFHKRKNIMNELYNAVDKNKLYFDNVGLTKYVNFYEYMDSKKRFDKLKNDQVKYDHKLNRQEEFLKKLNEVKIGKKIDEQKDVINNLDKFYHSREEVFNFFGDYTGMMFDSSYQAKPDETKRTGFQILTPKQMFQRLPIALAQVKTGNNSKVLLNKIRPIVCSFHQSKEITKKVYNNIIKSIQI